MWGTMSDVKVTQGSIYRCYSLNRQQITIVLQEIILRVIECEV